MTRTSLLYAISRDPAERHKVAIAAKATRGLSYWDAAIIEAARTLGCDVVLTEDLGHGQAYGGVTVVDPFR